MTGTVQSCYNLKNLVGPCDHAMTGTVKIVRWLKGYCRSVRSCDDWNRAILWWLGPCKAFGDLKDLVGPCDLVMTGILTVCAILQWLGPCESCNDLYSDWFVRLLQTRWCVLFRDNISSDWFSDFFKRIGASCSTTIWSSGFLCAYDYKQQPSLFNY